MQNNCNKVNPFEKDGNMLNNLSSMVSFSIKSLLRS